MHKNLKKYINSHIKSLGVKKNNNVLVYSDISKFGINNKKLPNLILSSLKKIIGPKGSIVLPFYIFGKQKKLIFEKKKFVFNSQTGILSKLFCKEKRLLRSKCLIHNHIGIGPSAKVLNLSKENITTGKNSDFEYMKNSNFKLLLLACSPMQGATYLHHLETINNVPYRKWILVKRKVLKNNSAQQVLINVFAKKNNKYVPDFNNVFKKIKKDTFKIFEKKVRYGKSYCITLKDLDNFGTILLKKNKYSLVTKIKNK